MLEVCLYSGREERDHTSLMLYMFLLMEPKATCLFWKAIFHWWHKITITKITTAAILIIYK